MEAEAPPRQEICNSSAYGQPVYDLVELEQAVASYIAVELTAAIVPIASILDDLNPLLTDTLCNTELAKDM
jgi:hypothetical protein